MTREPFQLALRRKVLRARRARVSALYKAREYRTIGGGRLGMYPRQCNVRHWKVLYLSPARLTHVHARVPVYCVCYHRKNLLSNDVFSRVYSRATLADTTRLRLLITRRCEPRFVPVHTRFIDAAETVMYTLGIFERRVRVHIFQYTVTK